MSLVLIVPILLLLSSTADSAGDADLVPELPGVLFQHDFRSYAGYVSANKEKTWRMFYWLTESRSETRDSDPLLVWFSGGPGCSSISGILEELGAFYVTKDGGHLFENVFSWNQRANVLALESPIGTGFSYDASDADFGNFSDDLSAAQNYAALADFFRNVQPRYANRTFFISGESYAGIYIPMLANLLFEGIKTGDFPNKKFQGFAIGNGFMDVKSLLNSQVLWSYYHGRLSTQEWDYVKKNCSTNGETDIEKYDFTKYLTSDNNVDFDSDNSTCGDILYRMYSVYGVEDATHAYSYYQDCYVGTSGTLSATAGGRRAMRRVSRRGHSRPRREAAAEDENPADSFWRDSTDTLAGFPCWADDATTSFLNKREVLVALHVSKEWMARGNKWKICTALVHTNYTGQHLTTRTFFDKVIANSKKIPNFRMLIYNGDVDTVCNYLGDAWFMRAVAEGNHLKDTGRKEWHFRDQIAGYVQHYQGDGVSLDVLTVKGAGHFVPMDRAGPSAQMITNFIADVDISKDAVNYSDGSRLNVLATPLPLRRSVETTTSSFAQKTSSALLILTVLCALWI